MTIKTFFEKCEKDQNVVKQISKEAFNETGENELDKNVKQFLSSEYLPVSDCSTLLTLSCVPN